MDFENMKSEFPKMPKEIEDRMNDLVQAHMNMETLSTDENAIRKKNHWLTKYKRVAVFVVTAILATSSVAYAANAIYKIHVEKRGKYQVDMSMISGDTTEMQEKRTIPQAIPKLSIQYSYIPKGYERNDGWDLFETNMSGGKFSARMIVMTDAFFNGDEKLEEKYTVESEALVVDGHEALLCEKDNGHYALHIIYPEYFQIVSLDIISDIGKTEILSVVEGIHVIDSGDLQQTDAMWTTDTINSQEDFDSEIDMYEVKMDKTAIFDLGEAFQLNTESDSLPLTAKVTNVTVTEAIDSLKNKDEIPDEWKELQTADGKLMPVKIELIKTGDGVESLDEVVETVMQDVKLVDITVEYTNHTEQTMVNVLHNCSLSIMEIHDDMLEMKGVLKSYYDEKGDYDLVRERIVPSTGEMFYYDTLNADGKNYISKLEPGESIVVHYAQVVYAEDVPNLYANFSSRTGYCFTEDNVKTGFVKIGQEKK